MIEKLTKANNSQLSITSSKHHKLYGSTKASMATAVLCTTLLCACQSTPTTQTSTPSTTNVIIQPSTSSIDRSTSGYENSRYESGTVNADTLNTNTDAYSSADDRNKAVNKQPSTAQQSSTPTTNSAIIQQKPTTEDWSYKESPIITPSQDDASSKQPEPSSVPSTSPYPSESESTAVIIIAPPKPDAEETRKILLERARQNSQTNNTSTNTLNNGDNLPAFRQLMDIGIAQLKANQLSAAESSFTRAQRLAPQSSAVYFYLGQVALKKNQPRKAEAVARRGLVVAQSAERRRALWQIILLAGQKQNNPRVVQEAQNALRWHCCITP